MMEKKKKRLVEKIVVAIAEFEWIVVEDGL